MANFLDVCRFVPTAGGTADWVYLIAVTGYQSPTAAGAINGVSYVYRAETADLSQWEIGRGVYNSSTGTFARTAVLYNSLGTTAKVNFSTVPQVAIVAIAEDLLKSAPGIQNGTIVETRSGGASTRALKTLNGNDPSSVDPVFMTFPDGSQGVVTGPLSLRPGGVLILGQDQDGLNTGFMATQSLIGGLDEVAIYDRALTNAEIQEVMRATTCGERRSTPRLPVRRSASTSPPSHSRPPAASRLPSGWAPANSSSRPRLRRRSSAA